MKTDSSTQRKICASRMKNMGYIYVYGFMLYIIYSDYFHILTVYVHMLIYTHTYIDVEMSIWVGGGRELSSVHS